MNHSQLAASAMINGESEPDHAPEEAVAFQPDVRLGIVKLPFWPIEESHPAYRRTSPMLASPSLLRLLAAFFIAVGCHVQSYAADPFAEVMELTPDQQLRQFLEEETERLEEKSAATLADVDAWYARQEQERERLAEMLGLSPRPEKTPLNATITGELTIPGVRISKLHYESMPGLYVTANLYRPEKVEGPCPAILYLCGHSSQKKGGVSYGNKAGYHHHGLWFARNGYVCLTIDTIQLGEFMGTHHGTYRYGMWWWNSRGYTPAGVEAWNGIRGLDYLQSLPEVDPERIGATGRSGGGAYSWYVSALDTRVKATVPVAGVTSARTHVVDGKMSTHCDCMFFVNVYQWDFAQLAALIAPRPLLLANTDNDSIFPLNGVLDVYWKTRRVYTELGEADKLGLAITEGPHADSQPLQVNAFDWMNQYLKPGKEAALIEPTAKEVDREDLKVFEELPSDEIVTSIQTSFVPVADPQVPKSNEEWLKLQEQWKTALKEKSFRAWPEQSDLADPRPVIQARENGCLLQAYLLNTQGPVEQPFLVVTPDADEKRSPDQLQIDDDVEVKIVDWNSEQATEWLKTADVQKQTVLFVPRNLGDFSWSGTEKELTHLRRSIALLGHSIDSLRLWDCCQMMRCLRKLNPQSKLTLAASNQLAGIALYVPLFTEGVTKLSLTSLPVTHDDGPVFLMVRRTLDIPQTLAMVASNCELELINSAEGLDRFARLTQRVPFVDMQPIRVKNIRDEAE